MNNEQERRNSFTLRVKAHFEANPNAEISAVELEAIGGRQAWRTRVSDCRKLFGMTITNKLYRSDVGVRSVYIYQPA